MHRIVAFTGAGISKASGVPTFEELGDLRDKLSRRYFSSNPIEFFKLLLEMKKTIDRASPNPAHIALAEYNIPIITMNIDGLHKKAGSKELMEIHGNLEYVFCPKCDTQHSYEIVEQSMYCNKCNKLLQPNVVLYGDSLPFYLESIDLVGSADELLVIGTSFYTSTASEMVYRAQRAGIKVTLINERAEEKVKEYLIGVYNK